MIDIRSRGRRVAALGIALLAASTLALAACGGGSSGSKTPAAGATKPAGAATKPASTTPAGGASSIPSNVGKDDKAQLTGAGATFSCQRFQSQRPANVIQARFFLGECSSERIHATGLVRDLLLERFEPRLGLVELRGARGMYRIGRDNCRRAKGRQASQHPLFSFHRPSLPCGFVTS